MKLLTTLLALMLLSCASAQAQLRPGAFTTIIATDTTATAVCVGCALGTTTPAANSGLAAASITLPSGVPSITTNKLYSIAGSLFFNGVGLAAGSSISGTTGKLSKFTSATSLSDSVITESGGAISVGGNLTTTGLLSATGFGTHGISAGGAGANTLAVRNTTAGAANFGALTVGNDASASLFAVDAFSSTFTPAAGNLANGVALAASGVGGLSIYATNGAGAMRFYAGGTAEQMRLHASGGFSIGNTTDPGATNLSVTGSGTFTSLVVSGNGNVGGTWTVGGNTQTATLTVNSTASILQAVAMGGVTLAFLGTPANGSMSFCSDCTPASSPCTGAGVGAMAFRQNGAWKCF